MGRKRKQSDSSLLIKLQRLSVRNAKMAAQQLPNLRGFIRLFRVEGENRVPILGEFTVQVQVERRAVLFRRQDVEDGFSHFRVRVNEGSSAQPGDVPNIFELNLTSDGQTRFIARFQNNTDMESFRLFFTSFVANLPPPDPENLSASSHSDSESSESSVAAGSPATASSDSDSASSANTTASVAVQVGSNPSSEKENVSDGVSGSDSS